MNLYNFLSQLTFGVRKIDDFSKLPIPFLCMATDVETGEEVILEHGDLAQASMASGSFPTLFAPVEMEGRFLTDGGVMNNYPIDEVRAKGMGSLEKSSIFLTPKVSWLRKLYRFTP